VERGLADAVIVTGAATGQPVDRDELLAVRRAVAAPVFIGSGLTPENAEELWPLADGAIVGTWWKRAGVIDRPVDVARVARLVEVLRALGPDRGRGRRAGGD
jgi:hypothetical protein